MTDLARSLTAYEATQSICVFMNICRVLDIRVDTNFSAICLRGMLSGI